MGGRGMVVVSDEAARAGRDAQAPKPFGVVMLFPFQELFRRHAIAMTGFRHGQQSAMYGGDHLGLATGDPSDGFGRRQVQGREHQTIRSDDMAVLACSNFHWAAPMPPPAPVS